MAENNQRRKPILQDSINSFFSSMVPQAATVPTVAMGSRQGHDMSSARSGVSNREAKTAIGRESLARLSADESGKFKKFIQTAGIELEPALAMGILEQIRHDCQAQVSTAVVGADQQQNLMIKNVPRGLDIPGVARILRQLDGTLPEDIAKKISLKAPLMKATGGVSDYTVAQIRDLPVSDALLRKLRHEDGAPRLPGTEHWYMRPSPEETQQDHLRVIPSPKVISMLCALKAARWTKVEIEQLFRKAANEALSGSPAFGAVQEVVMKDVKMLPAMGEKGGRKNPYKINFEEGGEAKIIFRDPETMRSGADRLTKIDCSLSALAGLPDVQMSLEFSTARTGGAYADDRQEDNRRKAVLRARQQVGPGTRLFAWTARLRMDWKREEYGRHQNMNPKAAEPILMQALGGRPRGLVAVALGYEPGRNTVLWNEEITLVIREGALASWMTKALSQGGGIIPVSGPWKSIVKHSSQRTATELKEVGGVQPDMADGAAAASRVAPSASSETRRTRA